MIVRSLSFVFVWLFFVVGIAAAQLSNQGEDLKAKVAKLLIQLEKGTEAEKQTAEWELLKLGPDILQLLPPSEKTAAGLKERLTGIRATLAELLPRTWTIKEEAHLPLGVIFNNLKAHTGLTLTDEIAADVKYSAKLAARKATYWEIIEELCAQGFKLSLYHPQGQLLTAGTTNKFPVSLHGPFRVAAKGISTHLDFETNTHSGKLRLEIAWEPRFSPYLIGVGEVKYTTHAPTPSHGPISIVLPPSGSIRVPEKNAKEIELTFPAPDRKAAYLSSVAGHFVVTMPVKSLEFNFQKPKQDDVKQQDGVTLTIKKLEFDKDWWTVELGIEVPAAGPKFESFQTWLGSNAWLDQCSCQFERGASDKPQIAQPDSLRTQIVGLPSATRVTVRYRFSTKNNLADPASWRLNCRVPGRMVEATVPFSFEKIDLP